MFAGSTHDLGVMGSSDHALMFRMELTEVARKFQVLMYTYFFKIKIYIFKIKYAFNVLPILYLYILYLPKNLLLILE